ncbi:MAG TPA: DNA methyltransferase [Lacunisphaera sp.]|nr:DNA methyltransferase [Lacunisphaera sp.]
MNALYYGDNLHVLRKEIPDKSVDLIYLDPPFNSKRDYNLLFHSPRGDASGAQIEAFEDTWHWNAQAENEFDELLHQQNVHVASVIQALRGFLGENDMMAYLTMMANRLLELHRVLKETGTLYLHCDPTASHYLKIVLDAVFGIQHYANEIIWKRSNPKSHGSINFPTCSDTIFRYTKGDNFVFHQPYESHDPEYVESAYRYSDSKGRYRLLPLLNPNDNRPNLTYEFLGVTRVWRWTRERMQQALADGLIVQTRPGAVPQYKKYLEDSKGRTVTNVWVDIEQAAGNEALGYPTQKPLALLERIIEASSNEKDIVLDPFCGCGTAVHAAHKLRRHWIGIDITHLAISLIEKRLKDAFGARCHYEVHGTPKDIDAAADLARRDKHQFQWWAVSLVDAQPYQGKKKGPDSGIDGIKFFRDVDGKGVRKIVVSVKGGANLKADDVRSLMAVREREKAEIGIFISLERPTKGMVKDAATAGFYESAAGKKFARIQLLAVADIIEGKVRAEHPDYAPDLNFKKATKESDSQQRELVL